MGRPRIGDVATRAGVSKTAVSFAFNQPEHLNAATRQRILAAAEELGYRPSPIARRLAARRTDQIGLVVPQPSHEVFANPFLSELLRGLGDVCDAENVAIVIVPPVGGSIARSVNEALVDGLVLLGMTPEHPELRQIRRAHVPIVALDIDEWADVDAIGIDDAGGARLAAQHLFELGHRDVAVLLIAQHPDMPIDERHGISARRLVGIREGFRLTSDFDADNGAVKLRLLSTPVSEEGGRRAFEELVPAGLPTAVMAMSDVTAIGVLNAARAAGCRVPEDLSIVGYDDVPVAAWSSPSLTTVHQPIREKGRRAARRLIDGVRAPTERRPVVEILPTRLVIRDSTGRPASPAAGNRREVDAR